MCWACSTAAISHGSEMPQKIDALQKNDNQIRNLILRRMYFPLSHACREGIQNANAQKIYGDHLFSIELDCEALDASKINILLFLCFCFFCKFLVINCFGVCCGSPHTLMADETYTKFECENVLCMTRAHKTHERLYRTAEMANVSSPN